MRYQIQLINVDRLIKLSEVESVLSKVFFPVPDRKTIYSWIEDGTLEGRQIGRGDNHYVFESSLNKFIENCQPSERKLAA